MVAFLHTFYKNMKYLILLTLFASIFNKMSGQSSSNLEDCINKIKKMEYAKGAICITETLNIDNSNAEAYYYRAYCNFMLKKPSVALVDCNHSILLNKNLRNAYLLRAKSHLELNNYPFSLDDFNTYFQQKGDTIAAIEDYISLLIIMNEIPTAISFLTHYIKNNPSKIDLYKKRALLFHKTDNFSEAIKDLNFYLSKDSKDTSAWMLKGDICYDASLYSEAIDAYNIVLLQDIENYRAMAHKADALMEMQSYDEAIKTYKKLLLFESYNETYLFNIGFSFLQQKLYKESVFYLSKAIEHATTTMGINLTVRGIAYNNLEEKEAACNDWKKALGIGFLDAKKYISNYCSN